MKKKYLQGNARERIFINIGLRAKLNEKGYFLFVYFFWGGGRARLLRNDSYYI